METITTIISLAFFIGLVLSPILIIGVLNKLNIRFKFIVYLTFGILITVIITLAFAWWLDKSNNMLLTHYGYNIDGMNESEVYGQVAPENKDRVKSLEKSIMGIGWPLKALMTYVVYLPYFLIVYYASHAMRTNRKKSYT